MIDHRFLFFIYYYEKIFFEGERITKHFSLQAPPSDPLQIFLNTLTDAQPDLEWIDDAVKKLHATKGEVIKRDLLQFSYDDEDEDEFEENDDDTLPRLSFIETGDEWYQKFRNKECEMSKRKEYCHTNPQEKTNIETMHEMSHIEKILEPKKFPRLPPVIPLNEDFDEFNKKSPSNKRQNDDLNTSYRNTLLEASNSEKLSKNEQETAVLESVNHPQEKRRSINPSNEIKLKISNRLMGKGIGPSLPSFGYASIANLRHPLPTKEIQGKFDDSFVFPYKEHELPNYNLFKREESENKEGDSMDMEENDEVYNDEEENEGRFGTRHLLTVSDDYEMIGNDHHHQKTDKNHKNFEDEFEYEKLAKEMHVFGPKLKDVRVEKGSKKAKNHMNDENFRFKSNNDHDHCTKAPYSSNPFHGSKEILSLASKNVPTHNESVPLVNINIQVNSNNSSKDVTNTTLARIEISKSKRFVSKSDDGEISRARRGKVRDDTVTITSAMKHLIEVRT